MTIFFVLFLFIWNNNNVIHILDINWNPQGFIKLNIVIILVKIDNQNILYLTKLSYMIDKFYEPQKIKVEINQNFNKNPNWIFWIWIRI